MTLTFKNEHLELISRAALNLPTKFGEDRPKDLGEVGEQTEKNINLTFDLDDLDLSKNEPLKLISGAALHLPSKFGEDRPKDLGGVGEQTNKQTDKRCSNYSMMYITFYSCYTKILEYAFLIFRLLCIDFLLSRFIFRSHLFIFFSLSLSAFPFTLYCL